MLNITVEYDGFTNDTQIIDNEGDDFIIILKLTILSIQSGVFLPLIISLMIWSTFKP